jgi:hypothetical protein
LSEDIDFGLVLNDGVSAPSKKIGDVLDSLANKMDHTSSAFEDALNGKMSPKKATAAFSGFSKEIARINGQGAKLNGDPLGYKMMLQQQKSVRDQQAKLRKEVFGDKHEHKESFSAKVGEEFGKNIGIGKIASGAFVGEMLAEGALKLGEVIIDSLKEGAEFFYDLTKDAFKAGAKHESLLQASSLSFGKEGGKEFIEDVERFSKQTRFDPDAIANLLLPIRRAGASEKEARSGFALAGDIAAGQNKGGSLEAIGGILQVLTKIQQNGGIGKRQLNEFGINNEAFYAVMARKLGVSDKEARKRVEDGTAGRNRITNTIAGFVGQQQGGIRGTGLEKDATTMQARWDKLATLPDEYLKKIQESPQWEVVSRKLGEIFDMLDPDKEPGKGILTGLMGAFGDVEDSILLALKPENITAFVAGIKEAVGIAKDLAGVFLDIVSAVDKLAKFQIRSAKNVTEFFSGQETDDPDVVNENKKLAAMHAQIEQQKAGPPVSVAAAAQGMAGILGTVTLNMHPGAIVVQGVPDAAQAKQAGQAVHDAAVDAFQRAGKERGRGGG